jgi:DNA-directed RNA polymerase subunit E'/Rpb7
MKNSFAQGLKILSFNRDTIKLVSKEKSLEEIFLSTLFLNYLIVLIVYLIAVSMGGITIGDKSVNMPVFFGLLMIYPFTFNIAT